MGGCLILESIALLNWCQKMGFGPIGITGVSMGGHNASLAGSSWDKPVSLVPCLSWTTGSCVFTSGVMSESIPWDVLENHYSSFDQSCRDELVQMIESPEDNYMFNAGKQFVKDFEIDTSSTSARGAGFLQLSSLSPFSYFNFGTKKAKLDILNFMRGIMDECTHLGNFSKPVDPELAIIVSALRDGYVPQDGIIPLTQVWPGSTRRVLNCGHVQAILFNSDSFRTAIADSLELNARKYYGTSLFNRKSGQNCTANN